VLSVGPQAPGKICGDLTGGGADESGVWTRLLGPLAMFLLRVSAPGTVSFSLDWSPESVDLDFFVLDPSQATSVDVRDVGNQAILQRFNGANKPETGTFTAAAQDYLIIAHNFLDLPASWQMEVTLG
jgi:hypothetical protein